MKAAARPPHSAMRLDRGGGDCVWTSGHRRNVHHAATATSSTSSTEPAYNANGIDPATPPPYQMCTPTSTALPAPQAATTSTPEALIACSPRIGGPSAAEGRAAA